MTNNADDVAEVRALRARLSELEERASSAAPWNAALRRAARPIVEEATPLLDLNDYVHYRRGLNRFSVTTPKAQKEQEK